MYTAEIFEGIGAEKLDSMLQCLRPEYREFGRGDVVLIYSEEPEHVCVLLSGRVHLDCLDDEGNAVLLEEYVRGDAFGEALALPRGGLGYTAIADSDCRVMFLRFEGICSRCSRACEQHSRLVRNLFRLAARRAQQLALRINLLSRGSVRSRLTAWLDFRSELAGSDEFDTGLSWSRLADYLCVDRTSLMRELRALRAEGRLITEGRRVKIVRL